MTNLRSDMRSAYIKLLKKYCVDGNLINLINRCIIDEEREREEHYLETGKYPEERNMLNKLKFDLLTSKKVLEAKAERRGGNDEEK